MIQRTMILTLGSVLAFHLVACASSPRQPSAAQPSPSNGKLNAKWTVGWTASSTTPFETIHFKNQTIRMTVRSGVEGQALRLRLSNRYGKSPVYFGEVHVALRESGDQIVAGTDRGVTFAGQRSLTLGPGQEVTSDPCTLAVPKLADLAVSLYLPEAVNADTVHFESLQTTFVSTPGNHVADVHLPVSYTEIPWFFVNTLDVLATSNPTAIVAFGDSLTDGTGSSPNKNRRWTDYLTTRLQNDHRPWNVLNTGIWGNRILHDGLEAKWRFTPGESALKRFDRDALDIPGAGYIILQIGGNDIEQPSDGRQASGEYVSVENIIKGWTEMAERAHRKHLKIFIGTLLPFGVGPLDYHAKEKERFRLAANRWIRKNSIFDGVVDFDQAVKDPKHPSRIRADFDRGDHSHLNDAGYAAMADAVDLKLFSITN